MGPLGALMRKEFIQFFRNRPMIIVFIYVIAVEIAICVYAITYDITNISLAFYDLDRSKESRELVERFARTPYFAPPVSVSEPDEMSRMLDSGHATIGIVIPPDFSTRLAQAIPAPVQLLVDGSNSNTALIALGYAKRIVAAYGAELEVERLQRAGADTGGIPQLTIQQRAWYSPAFASRDFVVVSMLVLAVMLIAVLHPAAALAWEKETGTIEQLLVMPFRTWELMLAKVAPTFVVSLASLGLSLWVPLWFEVPIRGNLLLFFVLSGVFLFSALGIGLLFGTIARNLQQALILGFFLIFPLFVISGTMVPVESMPQSIQLISYLSPLRYYLDIGLGIFLKGVGIRELWPQVLGMAALGLAIFSAGIWRFGRLLR